MIHQWWISLEPSMKILWAVTIFASLVFIIQSILTFIGAGGDIDTDFDTDTGTDTDGLDGAGTGMSLLTFRNFVNFCLGFGWTAILLRDQVGSTPVLLILSIVVGILLVILVMMLFKWLNSMQASGNIDVYKSAVGCEGTVYLPIPAERKETGKVQITISNAVREYYALTDGEAIPTGRHIKVVEVISPDTLLVEEANSYII